MSRHRAPLRFALVGLAATGVHMLIGIALIALGVAPLLANIGAFLTAFGVSFLGHHFYSFAGHGVGAPQSLRRFAGVALIGFSINQSVLAGLLRLIPDWPAPALVISTGTAAVATYLLSAYWAFRHGND